MATEPLARYRRFGFSLTVYPNRIEVERLGFLFIRNKRIIPMRNVASVDVARTTNQITVRTNDGKRYKWACGFRARKVQEAILRAL